MKIKKISLRSLNDNVMNDIELGHLLGGNECGCGCNGSSSHSSNMSANYAHSYLPGASCNYTSYDGEKYGCSGSTACINHALLFGPMYRIIKYLLSFLIITAALSANAQRKDTDAKVALWNFRKCRERVSTENASIRILYAFNAENIKDKDTWIDEGQLKIGKNITQYSSRFVELNEDSLANWLNMHPKSNVWPAARWLQGYKPGHWIEYQYSTIQIKNHILEEFATMPDAIESDNQKYSEQLPLQDWSILDESKEVCGYSCQKAICHWRGREYVAWFTSDIPVSAGPWKFGGLPGLIMKIADSTDTYSWEATEVKNGTFPIYEPRGAKYKESSREKVQELQRKLNENYFKTTGTEVIQYKTGKLINSRKHPYSQLELE